MTRLGWAWTVVIAGVALGAIGGGIYALGQMSDSKTTPTAVTVVSEGPEAKTADAARAAAQASLDAYSAGDWKGSWDTWTGSAKKVVSRDDYARYHDQCDNAITGPAFKITSIRLEAPDHAVVTADRLSFKFTYDVMYEDGHWRFQPGKDTISDFNKGVDALIAACKKS